MALHKHSWNYRLSSMVPAETRFYPTQLEWYANDMRSITSPRKPPEMKGMRFKSRLFTAISASDPSDVRHLICVERIA